MSLTQAPPRGAISAEMLLRRQPLFAALDAASLRRLAAAATRRSLARGELLFGQGALPTGMYVVVYGRIKMISRRRGTRGGRLTGIAGPGMSLGEPVMFLERPTLVEAVAADDSLVLHLPREAVDEEIERNPAFARHMIARLSQRVQSLVEELERRSSGTGRERLVDYLLRQSSAQGGHLVTLPASKAEIASQLQLTPEHLSRLLRELVDAGLLAVSGRKVHITDTARLAAYRRA